MSTNPANPMQPLARITWGGETRTVCRLEYKDGSTALVSGPPEDMVVYTVTLRPYVERVWAPDEVCLNVEDNRVTEEQISALVEAGIIAPPHGTIRCGRVDFPVARLLPITPDPALEPDPPRPWEDDEFEPLGFYEFSDDDAEALPDEQDGETDPS